MSSISAFIIALLVTRQICNPRSWLHILDHPNERSLHTLPVPRTGGVAILAGIFVAMFVYGALAEITTTTGWIAAALLMLAVISFIDDQRGLSVSLRLFGQIFSAGLLMSAGLWLQRMELPGVMWAWPPIVGLLVSMLYLVWMINLYNFMDGMDGFAAGMALFGFGSLGILGFLSDQDLFMSINLIIAAGASGFLIFNFPPARIFMGDTGSSCLGLLAAAMSLWGVKDGIFQIWVPLLIFSPFFIDASVTLFLRLLKGEKLWQAHKTHYYQRLVSLGWGHKKTVLWEYGLMACCSVTAIIAASSPSIVQWGVLIFWLMLYFIIMMSISHTDTESTMKNTNEKLDS